MPRPFSLLASVILALLSFGPATPAAASPASDAPDEEVSLHKSLAGLGVRGIGPAVMGGRIADIAIHPTDRSTWYLAVGSGGVWKTENAGVTWAPIFDEQLSYSIGCVTLDPSNPSIIWVGTGENVSGRHVGWGDGVYKSLDGGATWQRSGLESSEHIGKIVVDPRDGNVVYVAAEGPLWSSGGERGVYKTTDGGATWARVLHIDDDTGATDLEFDPRDPDVLYAATYQRRRHIWALLAGGPGSGIHKSTDGGATWRRLEEGLPEGEMGKIGLAVSPADPDVVYATIEAAEEERGFYRSRDRGESWEHRNDYISGGTGPHYYQEIEASPHAVGVVYQMDVFLHVTRDGGASFEVLGTGREKHSDNHALVLDPADPEHLIAGTDGGLYESFDEGAKWRHFPNLPISQFYKLAVSDEQPFYSVLAGAQDLGTLLGPAQTGHTDGVRNRDWYVPLGADGYACAFDPIDPDLAYMEWQGGRLYRLHRASGELVNIQPQPGLSGEDDAEDGAGERWNWDAPLLASSHAPGRLYFGSQRLWRSDDRGDSWTPISGDLTRGANRYTMPMSGGAGERVRSIDSLYDTAAMSVYATLAAVSESPKVEGLLYTGSDDGLVHVSEDGGGSWRRAAFPPGVPDTSRDRAFVNDLHASQHDPDGVFLALDAHKIGDYRPLLYESRDRGRTWRSIAGDLPPGHLVWSVVQDHEKEDLLFAGTEYGIFFTVDRGRHWTKLRGSEDGGEIPTIAFRDLAIQRRENDLVGASFGRGIYVLDDYSPLRELVGAAAASPRAHLFPVRDAWWYVPSVPMQAKGKPSQGSDDWSAPNPPYGALITYYLQDIPKTAKEERQATESELRDRGEDLPIPGWDRLAEEVLDDEPRVLLTICDEDGRPVRRLEGPAETGAHRVSWDLRYPPPDPVNLEEPGFRPPWYDDPQGPLVAPGRYEVRLELWDGGEARPLAEPRWVTVKPLPGSGLEAGDYSVIADFHRAAAELQRQLMAAAAELGRAEDRLRYLDAAIHATPGAGVAEVGRLAEIRSELAALRVRLLGDPIRGKWNEPGAPTAGDRLGLITEAWSHTRPPTQTQKQNVEIAGKELKEIQRDLGRLLDETLPALEEALEKAGAPHTPGRGLPIP